MNAPANVVNIRKFIPFICLQQEAAAQKEAALVNATRAMTHLVKVAKANGRPHRLIVSALRTQLGLVRELSKIRGE